MNYYSFVCGLNIGAFVISPWIGHHLPFLLQYPFDPYKTELRFNFFKIYESLSAMCCTATNVSINMYMFVVFICLNFYYSLLSERAKQLGHQIAGKPKQTKNDFYREMIELINFHLKINK